LAAGLLPTGSTPGVDDRVFRQSALLKNGSLPPRVHNSTSYSPPPWASRTDQGAALASTFTPPRSSPTRSWVWSAKKIRSPIAPTGLGPAYSRGAAGGGGGGGGGGGSAGLVGFGGLRTGGEGMKNALRPLKRFADASANCS
jgi:hypothetical protein